MRIGSETKNTEPAGEARAARTFWSRLVGLLGRSALDRGEGLLIEPCRSVHTAFMRCPIDVVTVDRSGRRVQLVSNMHPFRMSGTLRDGRAVIELPAGTIAETHTVVGDQLVFEP